MSEFVAVAPAPAAGRPGAGALALAFVVDVALALLLVVGVTVVFIVPVLALQLRRMAGADGVAPSMEALVAASTAEITAASLLAMLVAAVLVWLLRGRRLRDAAEPMPVRPAYVLAVAAGVAVQAAGLGLSLLSDWLAVPADPSNIAPLVALQQQWPWFAWLAVVAIAPVSEELLFRHLLLRRFLVAGRGVAGVVVTSLLFAAMHELAPGGQGVASWLVTLALYLLLGAGFGAVYVLTRRLGAAIAAHATCNLLAMGLLTFSGS